jgi:two-component system chemotaxis response regulator CheB
LDKIRVLVVDDSAIVRSLLTEHLSRHPRIEVVASAVDPYVARNKLETLDVDVITLDIEMPRMDGLTFLRLLMKHDPRPVIVVSSLTAEGNEAALKALELGAVDVVPKPGGPFSVQEVIDILVQKILAAPHADLGKLKSRSERLERSRPLSPPGKVLAGLATTNKLVVVGASTGGTGALEEVFTGLPAATPPILTVIHMPERFTASFAHRLDGLCRVRVKEAEDGEKALAGTVYIAAGNYHLSVVTRGAERLLKVHMGPKVFSQRPAVDVLFRSAAEEVGRNCLGILLTGMGKDGAEGLLKIRQAGGRTVAQDEATSIVFGMPKEAIALGAAEAVLGLGEIVGYGSGHGWW